MIRLRTIEFNLDSGGARQKLTVNDRRSVVQTFQKRAAALGPIGRPADFLPHRNAPRPRPAPSADAGSLVKLLSSSPAPAGNAGTRASGIIRLAVLLSLVVAGIVLSVWFWSRVCRFPTVAWNDLRLAPTIALAQGWPVYATATQGTINTWMYGPLPLLYFWPASWASTSGGALMVAGLMNLALTLVPLAVVCWAWPVREGGRRAPLARLTAFVLGAALYPEYHYSIHFSDNLAIACGALGNLLLVRSESGRARWLAAALAVATLGCKQIALGIPLAQILWLGCTGGVRAGMLHAWRCTATGVIIGGAIVAAFGWNGLWYTLVETPAGFGWATDPANRLWLAAPDLALLVGLPLVVMVAGRGTFLQPLLLLPALAWICTLPLGLAGLLKLGGWANSIHGFVLWLPPVAVTFRASPATEGRRRSTALVAALLAATITTGRILREPDFPLHPQTAAHQEAERLAGQFPQGIWFPLQPLVTLYSDRRYYHDEDGFYVRTMAKKPLSPGHVAAHLPSAMKGMAFYNQTNDWGIARGMLPPGSISVAVGNWTLRGGVAERYRK